MFLIAGKILEMDDLAVMGGQLGMYTLTVIVGLLIHALCILPLLYFIVTHRNPCIHCRASAGPHHSPGHLLKV